MEFAIIGVAVLSLVLSALQGHHEAGAGAQAIGSTICDRGSDCDLFGCDPDCDTFVGDAEPPSTTLKICGGDLPSQSVLGSHDAPCYTYDLGATDTAAPDYLGHANDDEFKHVYYVSGDPACVGTGPPIGSGRDCNADSGPDGQCGYFAEGFHVYGLTGGSCSQHGVGLCSGPFCR